MRARVGCVTTNSFNLNIAAVVVAVFSRLVTVASSSRQCFFLCLLSFHNSNGVAVARRI